MASDNQKTYNDEVEKIKNFILYLYKNTKDTKNSFKIIIYISLFITFLSFILSLFYIFMIILMLINKMTSSKNNEELDTNTIRALASFKRDNTLNLSTLIKILPIISLFLIGIFFLLTIFIKENNNVNSLKKTKMFAIIIGIFAFFAIILQFLVYKYIATSIVIVNERIDTFNKFVCVNLYKNIAFLSKIEKPQISIIGVNTTIRDCLRMIYQKETSETDLTKAFYTLTLFNHFQQLSLRSKNIYNSFKIFDYMELLGNKCYPALYLSMSGTYIEDINDTLIVPNLPSKINNIFLDKALTKCNEWLIRTNELANTIYPQDAFTSFIVVSVLNIIIHSAPIFVLYKMSTSSD